LFKEEEKTTTISWRFNYRSLLRSWMDVLCLLLF